MTTGNLAKLFSIFLQHFTRTAAWHQEAKSEYDGKDNSARIQTIINKSKNETIKRNKVSFVDVKPTTEM